MPADNPQVGETWEWNDPMQGRNVRAVVIALGTDGLRLMARTGKRTALPLRSFIQMWRFYAPEPEPHLCSHDGCENIAFFRNYAEDWICQEHVPFNTSVALPTETVVSEDLRQLECPECESAQVEQGDLVSNQSRERTYQHQSCRNCNASWFLVPGRGADTDGLHFAEDLPLLAARFTSVQIRLGFLARRSLARAIGMRSANHLGGYTLMTNNQFGDNTALVIQPGRDPSLMQQQPPNLSEINVELGSTWRLRASGYTVTVISTDPDSITIRMSSSIRTGVHLPHFNSEGTFVLSRQDFFRDYEYTRAPLPEIVRETIQASLGSDENDVQAGSVWRRRRNDNRVLLCRVEHVTTEGFVSYNVFHNPSNLSVNSLGDGKPPLMEVDQFLDHWDRVKSDGAAMDATNNEPNEGTFWRHIENRQVVRIGSASVTQRMNNQVVFVTLEKDQSSAASVTFQRLYREMPFPPTKTPWYKDGTIFEVASMEGAGDYRNIKTILSWTDGEKQIPFFELLEDYDPIAFEDESMIEKRMQAGSTWISKNDNTPVTVRDIGTVRDLEFIRFKIPNEVEPSLLPIEDFLNLFEFQEVVSPAILGEEWSFMDRAVYRVKEIFLRRRTLLFERSDGKSDDIIEVPFSHLEGKYRKIERKSAFTLLDDDWDDD